MLELAKAVHSAIGTDSPRLFICVFAVLGALLFGGIGWIVDQGFQKSLKTPGKTETTTALQPAQDVTLSPAPAQESNSTAFTNRTPRQLLALYEGRTVLQADRLMEPYKGLWIVADGQVSNLIPDVAGITAVLRNGNDLINARFDKKWELELSRVNDGDTVKIRGKLGDTQNGQQLYLLECEVVR